MTIDVVTVRDAAAWRQALAAMPAHDFSHTHDFHRISEANGEGEAVAYVARDSEQRPMAFWPVLRRDIPDTEHSDLTSVYGYAGPLFADGADVVPYMRTLLEAMRASGAVALFSRVHPLFVDRVPEDVRGQRLSEVVVIEVGADEDVTRQYRGSHRREIVKTLEAGVRLEAGSSPSLIAEFDAVYGQAMAQLNARDYYHFSADYITSVTEAVDFETIIVVAKLDDAPISASMFTVTGGVMQYYLSGTVDGHRKQSPSKAIIAEAHRLAVQRGLRHLILGGGVGSSRDPLFAFKAGFSETAMPFHVIREVLDPPRYRALCETRGSDPDVSFFPAYRAPLVAAAAPAAKPS